MLGIPKELTDPQGPVLSAVTRLAGAMGTLAKSLDEHSKALKMQAASNERLAGSLDEQGLRR